MSDKSTKHLLPVFEQNSKTEMFLSSLFASPSSNFYSGESVEIDVVRDDEDISIAILDPSTGYAMNSADIYTNKMFKPPVHKEGVALNSHELVARMPGDNPFKDPKYRANLVTRMMNGMVKVAKKIRRSMELQASQILQTGKVNLTDTAGNIVYTLDFKAKVSHFPTAGIAWNAAGSDKLGDIQEMCERVRDDGLGDVDQIIMGEKSYMLFAKDDEVLKVLDNRRADIGAIVPMRKNVSGGNYRGTVEVGNYKVDIWTYNGRYKDPETSTKLKYVKDESVIARVSSARMDKTFGNIPHIGTALGIGRNLLPELPGRLASAATGIDLHPNVWLSADGETLNGGVSSRPLLIPTDIDSFACLDTGIGA